MQTFSKKLLTFIRKPSFLALIYFVVMSIGMTYPLIAKMGTAALGGGGDGTYFIWLIRWYQKAMFQLKISPFFDPYLNYPQGFDLASTDVTPAMVALALPGKSALQQPHLGVQLCHVAQLHPLRLEHVFVGKTPDG